jgi:hypothetical protein
MDSHLFESFITGCLLVVNNVFCPTPSYSTLLSVVLALYAKRAWTQCVTQKGNPRWEEAIIPNPANHASLGPRFCLLPLHTNHISKIIITDGQVTIHLPAKLQLQYWSTDSSLTVSASREGRWEAASGSNMNCLIAATCGNDINLEREAGYFWLLSMHVSVHYISHRFHRLPAWNGKEIGQTKVVLHVTPAQHRTDHYTYRIYIWISDLRISVQIVSMCIC